MEGATPKVAVAFFSLRGVVETQDSCPAMVWLRLYNGEKNATEPSPSAEQARTARKAAQIKNPFRLFLPDFALSFSSAGNA